VILKRHGGFGRHAFYDKDAGLRVDKQKNVVSPLNNTTQAQRRGCFAGHAARERIWGNRMMV
jgi:hypothetical protein